MGDKNKAVNELITPYAFRIPPVFWVLEQAWMAINDSQNIARPPSQLPAICQRFFMQRKAPPIKERPRIGFAPRGNVGVTDNRINWIKFAQ